MLDGLTVIREMPENITWQKRYEDNYRVFSLKGLQSHYDCYSYRLLEPTKHHSMLVRIAPRLEVFSSWDMFFIGEIPLHYHILDNNQYGFGDILREITKKAHQEFIRLFTEREATTDLHKFEPIFQDEVLEIHIDRLLRAFP